MQHRLAAMFMSIGTAFTTYVSRFDSCVCARRVVGCANTCMGCMVVVYNDVKRFFCNWLHLCVDCLLQKPSSKAENVHVAVRCRPLTEKEIRKQFRVVVQVDEVHGEVRLVHKLGRGTGQDKEDDRTYYFDSVFGIESRQADIFNITARPIVDSVIEGYNGTIFAYGQTGTGKTYTMEGDKHVPELRGITPNTFAHLFYHIGQCDGQVQ